MNYAGQYSAFTDVAILGAVRTPWIDVGGALAQVSPIDLGIKVGREVLARAGFDPRAVDSVLAGSMAQASFDAYLLPRHIGLYSGVPQQVPALAVQRICATGFELLRQAGEQLRDGVELALCVGAESMSRNPIAAYTHRDGFRLGASVDFKDFLWEALYDPAPGLDMIATAENLARRHGLSRETVDTYALNSHEQALHAQASDWFADEIVAVRNESFELDGYQPRGITLPRRVDAVTLDSHIRPTDLLALATLRAIHAGACKPLVTAVRWWTVRRLCWSVAHRRVRDRHWQTCWRRRWSAWRRSSWGSARLRRSSCCCSAAGWSWTISPCLKSTRRRARRCWQWPRRWSWTPTSSTDVAAQLPSAIHWPPPACVW